MTAVHTKTEKYRKTLATLTDWDSYLLQESGLPGKRANIELARAVAEHGDRAMFERWLALDADRAPTNCPHEFLAFCGVLGLGKLLARGDRQVLQELRCHASDARWRIREAVAMALQYLGKTDMQALLEEMERWSEGSPLEQRAAVAALCEPDQLRVKRQTERVLAILDGVTTSLQVAENRRSEEFKALRKGLGYCWSVAVVAHPEAGKEMMERWFASEDRDVLWVMKQNLRKNRLARMDAEWVAAARLQLGM
jgi:hypothetical protein